MIATSSDIAQQWLIQATSDLEVARLLAINSKFDWAAYASAQAAEKAVKAMLVAWGAEFGTNEQSKPWKIHKLSDLFHAFRRLPRSETMTDALTTLPKHDQLARYPDPATHEAPCLSYTDPQLAQALIEQSAAVVEYARRLVPAIVAATLSLESAASAALVSTPSPQN